MGMYASATLLYGYDLGEYTVDPDEAQDTLLKELGGFTLEFPARGDQGERDAYWEAYRVACARFSFVTVESYGFQYERQVLATGERGFSSGLTRPEEIAPWQFEAPLEWDINLRAAARALDLTIENKRPSWLLLASYG